MLIRNGNEVDFLARDAEGHETLIQVCADLAVPATLAREVRALKKAAMIWPQADLQLITLGRQTQSLLPPGMKVLQAADWLLSTTPGLGGDSHIKYVATYAAYIG